MSFLTSLGRNLIIGQRRNGEGIRRFSRVRCRLAPMAGDLDTSFSSEVRQRNGSYGLLPPAVETSAMQSLRCLKQLALKEAGIDKYLYLSTLRSANPHLFYRLITEHIKDLTPIIYTPTVGEACIQWSHNYVQPEGLYLSFADRGKIGKVLQNWPQDRVEITVVTDGSRILGLGDLGVNGMGIPVGKLALYVACGGIRPEATLPLVLDFGTSNESLINDPLYLGSKQPHRSNEEELEFMDELMIELQARWPGIVVQFEDFKNPIPALERYQSRYSCFNDDYQGTGAVVLSGMINAIRHSGREVQEHRAVVLGAGSAGVGVAKQIAEFFKREGMTEDEARAAFWLVDSGGLVTHDRGELPPHKAYFARRDIDGQTYTNLAQVMEHVKPTILMGLSTMGGAFTPDILRQMGQWNKSPIIFPLSNPSANSECTFKDAVRHTEGRVLFASGSPFSAFHYHGSLKSPGQGKS